MQPEKPKIESFQAAYSQVLTYCFWLKSEPCI